MFKLSIKNTDTNEVIIEEVDTEKELDDIVGWFYDAYGDALQVSIESIDNALKTRPYSERPVCQVCFGKLLVNEICECDIEDFSLIENSPPSSKDDVLWII